MSLIYTKAFSKYGATLNNQKWSVSAFGSDGCLVVSLWQDSIKPGTEKGTLVYRDTLSLWKGNDAGRNELRSHLNTLKNTGSRIKLVIAHPLSANDASLVGKVSDESKIKKTFSIRKDVLGTLKKFDDDFLCIEFGRVD